VPFLCSDDLWRFGSALDASVSLRANRGYKCLAMLTNEGSEMAYELRDPSSRHKKEAGAYFLQSFPATDVNRWRAMLGFGLHEKM
jgi:hypothetical protein